MLRPVRVLPPTLWGQEISSAQPGGTVKEMTKPAVSAVVRGVMW